MSLSAAAMEERWRRRNMKARSLPSWKLRVPGYAPPRWARVHLYNLNRDRHFRNLAAAAALPQSDKTTIHDLPVEIMVKIFWLVLASNNMEYNLALPRVCARWTRIAYDYVYVQGFGVPDYSGLLKEHLDLFATTLGESHYNAVLPEDVCRSVLGRYRLGMDPRVIAYTILIAEEKEGCVHSQHAVRGTQQFCIKHLRRAVSRVDLHGKNKFYVGYLCGGIYPGRVCESENKAANRPGVEVHSPARRGASHRHGAVDPV